MRKFFLQLMAMLLTGAAAPVPAFAAEQGSAVADSTAIAEMDASAVSVAFLQTTSDMWFLLSGIRDKDDADRAAARFLELVGRVYLLDDRLSELSSADASLGVAGDTDCAGQLDELQVRILESFEDLNTEFAGLCRVQCYGSQKLNNAFREAVASGMFGDGETVGANEVKQALSESESKQEAARMGDLLEPDRAMLSALEKVCDPASAALAVPELVRVSKRLGALMPKVDMETRSVPAAMADSLQKAYTPLEPLLWGIRNELVRIAGLPGYETESYDDFSAALENAFENLSQTHSEYFDSVFDACFRDDMDEAVQEKATTATTPLPRLSE